MTAAVGGRGRAAGAGFRATCLGIVLLASGCISVQACRAWNQRHAAYLLSEARAARSSGDLARAEALWLRALAKNPDLHEARWELANLALTRGDAGAATEHLQLLVDEDSVDLERCLQWSQDLIAAHRYGDADRLLSIVLRREPLQADALSLKGQIEEVWGRSDAALDYYYRALSQDQDRTETQVRVANIHLQNGQVERALPMLLRAADRAADPVERSGIHLAVAKIYAGQERWSDAASACTRGLKAAPSAELLALRAEARSRNGDWPGAWEDARAALLIDPKHPAALELAGRLPSPRESRSDLLPAGHKSAE